MLCWRHFLLCFDLFSTFYSLFIFLFVLLGALVVTLRQGKLKGKEEEFLERVLTGGDPDPYVVISVLEDESSAPPENIATRIFRKLTGNEEIPVKKIKKSNFARVLDSGKSLTKVRVNWFVYIICILTTASFLVDPSLIYTVLKLYL